MSHASSLAMASKLPPMSRDASRARAAAAAPSRTAAAAPSRAAAMSFRSACGREESILSRAPAAASRSAREAAASGPLENLSSADYELFLPDDVDNPTEKDFQSDEAQWAYYQRWCKAHNKKYDHDEMARRFHVFIDHALAVYQWNTCLPSDPVKAAIFRKKREKVKLLLSKGKDISKYNECLVPMELSPFADEP